MTGRLLAIDGLNIVRRVYEASPEPDSDLKAEIALRHAFSAFQRRYPTSGYGQTAQYWLANALYCKRYYKEAIAAFR